MSGSGKIEAAIERMKQHYEATGLAPLSERGAGKRTLNDGRMVRRSAPAKPPTMPQPPVVDYDRRQCAKHRLLLPGADMAKNGRALSAYRQLRTRVLQRARSHGWSAIGVTSPGAGQGKTINAINLAINIAREKNNNVFLLDLDLRNPSVCKYLGVQPPTELLGYFTDSTEFNDIFFSIGVENLMLAGSTMGVEHSSELLSTGKVEELLDHIRKVAPQAFIVIDMPPVLSNDDALVVAPKVDGLMIVISQGVSRRDAVAQTIELMDEFNIAGLVLNRSDSLVSDYYGYGS